MLELEWGDRVRRLGHSWVRLVSASVFHMRTNTLGGQLHEYNPFDAHIPCGRNIIHTELDPAACLDVCASSGKCILDFVQL